jgi:hypothetical protein
MGNQNSKTAIIVALIGLIGVLGAAMLGNKPPTPSSPTLNPPKDEMPSPSLVEPKEQFTIVGTWLVYEPNVGNPLTSITLSQDNQYQGGSWGRDFGGPKPNDYWDTSNKGLGANQYSFDGEVLSFNYSEGEGLLPIDEPPIRLTGNVRVITSTEIEFTVTGGLYGNGENLGKVFRLRK